MDNVIKVIGIIFIGMGIFYFLKPAIIRRIITFLKKGSRIYLIALVRFALAIVFLLGARECDITWVIVTFAILFLISGMLIFMLGGKKLNAILDWYLSQPVFLLRILASILILAGGVIVYSA